MPLTDVERRRVRFLTDYYNQPVPESEAEAPPTAPAPLVARSAHAPADESGEPPADDDAVDNAVIVVDQPEELDDEDDEEESSPT